MSQMDKITHNVHEHCGTEIVRVSADIDRKIYDYFFRHVIPYSHGARQAMITHFFQSLYEECQRQNIPAHWDESFGPTKITEILNRLNFHEQRPEPTTTKRRSRSART